MNMMPVLPRLLPNSHARLLAQVTRLLVGDELGDALGLPFDVHARKRALRNLRLLRLYTCACSRGSSATCCRCLMSPPHSPN